MVPQAARSCASKSIDPPPSCPFSSGDCVPSAMPMPLRFDRKQWKRVACATGHVRATQDTTAVATSLWRVGRMYRQECGGTYAVTDTFAARRHRV